MAAPSPSPSPPFRRRDDNRLLVSYAQVREDARLARVFWDKPPGLYVDVGAGDPTEGSVTKLFYDDGWQGINIEPGPMYKRLVQERPRDINVNVAVGAVAGPRDFWVTYPDSGLSSLEEPRLDALPPGMRVMLQSISCRPLNDILEENCQDRPIDFLKVDVEGAEEEVLRTLDLERFRPVVLLVEAVAPLTFEPSHERWEPHVLERGYVFAAFDGVNRFYVPREHEALCAVLGYPMSLLDLFVDHNNRSEARKRHFGAMSYPTLDVHLATRADERDAPTDSRVTAVVADAGMVDRVREVIQDARLVVPSADELNVVDGSQPVDEPVERAPLTLSGVRVVLRDSPPEVLLISEVDKLASTTFERLRTALTSDSACATISVGDTASDGVLGLPPPGVEVPVPGVVLARRHALILAIEEADAYVVNGSNREEAEGSGSIIQSLLAALERPGFVHRVVGRDARATSPSPLSTNRRRRATSHDVAIDGSCFSSPITGTQVQVLGLLGALGRAGTEVAVLRPPELHSTVKPHLDRLPRSVRLVDRAHVARPTVFHRPFQIRSLHELADCLSMGERLVLTHQDMILDRTPAYADGRLSWGNYRLTTRAAFASADDVGFFSLHAALDAASEGSLEPDRATVVHLGVDHVFDRDVARDASAPLDGRPYLLTVGASFVHKNRLFALRLLQWLVDEAGWDGGLVFTGTHVRWGSSVPAEEALLAARSDLRARVVDLGHVSEAVQGALYRDAELVVFPSIYEGFGFVPFEAAAMDTACVYAHQASMRELLPETGALPSFDLHEAGPFVHGLLKTPSARQTVVAAIRERAASLTWDRTAAGYLEIYRRSAGREPRSISRLIIPALAFKARDIPELSAEESLLLDVFRRRRSFRIAVRETLRAGLSTLDGVRRLRKRMRPASQ